MVDDEDNTPFICSKYLPRVNTRTFWNFNDIILRNLWLGLDSVNNPLNTLLPLHTQSPICDICTHSNTHVQTHTNTSRNTHTQLNGGIGELVLPLSLISIYSIPSFPSSLSFPTYFTGAGTFSIKCKKQVQEANQVLKK